MNVRSETEWTCRPVIMNTTFYAEYDSLGKLFRPMYSYDKLTM